MIHGALSSKSWLTSSNRPACLSAPHIEKFSTTGEAPNKALRSPAGSPRKRWVEESSRAAAPDTMGVAYEVAKLTQTVVLDSAEQAAGTQFASAPVESRQLIS